MRVQGNSVAHGIAGDGVYVDDRTIAPGGGLNGMPDWNGPENLIWPSEQWGATVSAPADGSTSEPVRVTDNCNLVRASLAGHWAAWTPDRGVWTSWGLSLPLAVLLDMSDSGALLVGDYYHSEQGAGISVYRPGDFAPYWNEPDATPALFLPYPQAAIVNKNIAIWTEPSGRYTRRLRAHGLPPINLPWSVLHPTACVVEGSVWVTYMRPDDSLVSHPWAFDGTGLLADGTGFGPDGSCWQGDVYIRWSIGAAELPGEIRSYRRSPQDRITLPPVQQAPQPPPPSPANPPKDDEEHHMRPLESAVLNTVRRLQQVWPVPQGDGSEEWVDRALRKGWTPAMQAQVVHEHGERYGSKARDAHAPVTKESLAYMADDGLHVYDMLRGAGGGRPFVPSTPDHHYVPDQLFIPVRGENVVWQLQDQGQHPRLPKRLWGMSAFDLFCRFAEGDYRYYDEIVRPSGLTPRIVVASIWNGGVNNRTHRSLHEGRQQLERGLQVLSADGVQCVPTLLVDTAVYSEAEGLTRESALEHVELCNEIMARWPEAVAAVRIGNELSHSVEAEWMSDPRFHREARALIDKRFAVANGAGHGGEMVLVGGSYTVHHSNRALTPQQNGAIMDEAQAEWDTQVVDDEPLGITEPDRTAGRQRTSDPDYARQLAQAALDFNLGGVTLHLDSGIGCRMEEHGDVHRAAMAAFVAVAGTSRKDNDVTPEQIALVFAGAFFERISALLGLNPQAPQGDRREAIQAWAVARLDEIERAYVDIFGRSVDLEGAGSRLLLYLDRPGYAEADLRRDLQADKDRGGK